MRSFILSSVAIAAVAVTGFASTASIAGEVPEYHGIDNLLTFQDITKHFGMVPEFVHFFPDAKLAAIWEEYKDTQIDPNTVLDAKTKQLAGLAAAVQAECGACIYFHASAAFASGADFKEVREVVAISALTGRWSEFLTDETFSTVKKDTDALVQRGAFDVPTASN
jgi:AhpD family alkylhydroperoxidase